MIFLVIPVLLFILTYPLVKTYSLKKQTIYLIPFILAKNILAVTTQSDIKLSLFITFIGFLFFGLVLFFSGNNSSRSLKILFFGAISLSPTIPFVLVFILSCSLLNILIYMVKSKNFSTQHIKNLTQETFINASMVMRTGGEINVFGNQNNKTSINKVNVYIPVLISVLLSTFITILL